VEAEERDRLVARRPDGAAETSDGAEERPPLGTETPSPHERCAHHPGRPAIARCDRCEEAVCLACAVPVRGRVLGPGCVAAELGDPGLTAPPETERGAWWIAVGGALVALVGTAAPWTRTGAGDRIMGAWVLDVRWSMVAAIAAVALLVVTWRGVGARARSGVVALGLVVSIASALAIAFPPTFQVASWGPWVSAVGGAVAALAAWLLAREPRPTRGD
jgi:hypothetical protein